MPIASAVIKRGGRRAVKRRAFGSERGDSAATCWRVVVFSQAVLEIAFEFFNR
jgi:hypothetical protein